MTQRAVLILRVTSSAGAECSNRMNCSRRYSGQASCNPASAHRPICSQERHFIIVCSTTARVHQPDIALSLSPPAKCQPPNNRMVESDLVCRWVGDSWAGRTVPC